MLKTERLLLRTFTIDDAPDVQRLAGAREVALNTLHIPHPYPDGAAEAWIEKQEEGAEIVFAIEAEGQLAGAIGLVVDPTHDRGELGYWIGVPFWGRGYATEAGRAMVRFGFGEQKLQRIFAQVFSRNPASARVLEKIGMRHEGTLRHHLKKWGEYVDVECYGIIRGEFEGPRPA
ncbi:MAG TPA: GNAT family N-acetyltransferase [Thermoanaerobaculia bacterium]|nr:GNAT family N-acetyltransferase [Thermoanaerobaculia bacterium]